MEAVEELNAETLLQAPSSSTSPTPRPPYHRRYLPLLRRHSIYAPIGTPCRAGGGTSGAEDRSFVDAVAGPGRLTGGGGSGGDMDGRRPELQGSSNGAGARGVGGDRMRWSGTGETDRESWGGTCCRLWGLWGARAPVEVAATKDMERRDCTLIGTFSYPCIFLLIDPSPSAPALARRHGGGLRNGGSLRVAAGGEQCSRGTPYIGFTTAWVNMTVVK